MILNDNFLILRLTNEKAARAYDLALFSLVHLIVPPDGRSYKLLPNKLEIVAWLICKRIGQGKKGG